MRLSRQKNVILALFLTLLAACASVPRFDELKQVPKSATLQEALWICGGYRLPDPARRPVDLKPLVECVNQAAERHPPHDDVRFQSALPEFQRELNSGYSYLRDSNWSAQLGRELDAAIHAGLRILWESPGAVHVIAEREQEALAAHFPAFSRL